MKWRTVRLSPGHYLVGDRFELIRTREGCLHTRAIAWYWRDRQSPACGRLESTKAAARVALAAHIAAAATMATCPTCGGSVQRMADGRLIRHFDLRNRPQWCGGDR